MSIEHEPAQGRQDGSVVKWATLLSDLDESLERKKLRSRIQRLIDKWQPILGLESADVEDWDLRKMKLYCLPFWFPRRHPI